jgi:hypothetical protein
MTTAWQNTDLNRIAEAQELTIQARRADGSLRNPLPIWVVRAGDELYIRSYKGDAAAWYRTALAGRAGHVSAGGVEADVEFGEATDGALNDQIDEAYRAKYASYGASYTDAMTSDTSRATTLRLTPR